MEDTLIQRGGGTGPMMPGNQRKYGANSCSEKLRDERGTEDNKDLFLGKRSFLF
jgi:hypothetical protein